MAGGPVGHPGADTGPSCPESVCWGPAPSWWDTGPQAGAQGTREVMPAAGEALRRVLGTGHMEPGGGQDRAKTGPDAEPSSEAHRPGDGAQQLSSWAHRKGSPAWSARGRSQHGCQTLEGRKPPLEQEARALPAQGAVWQAAGGAEAGDEGRWLRIFLREGEPQGEGKRQESGWVKINTHTQTHSGKGHGAHSGDCEPEPRSVNPGRPAGTGDSSGHRDDSSACAAGGENESAMSGQSP